MILMNHQSIWRTIMPKRSKNRQTSKENPSFVIIKSEDFSFHVIDPNEAFENLRDTVENSEDILGVIIINDHMGSIPDNVNTSGMNLFIVRQHTKMLISQIGIVFNRFYKNAPITMDSLSRISSAFKAE